MPGRAARQQEFRGKSRLSIWAGPFLHRVDPGTDALRQQTTTLINRKHGPVMKVPKTGFNKLSHPEAGVMGQEMIQPSCAAVEQLQGSKLMPRREKIFVLFLALAPIDW